MLRTHSRLSLLVLFVVVLSPIAARSEAAVGEEAASANAASADTTVVDGAVPAGLVGRWLLAADVRSLVPGLEASATSSVILRTFEVKEKDGRLTITLDRGVMSEELKRQIDVRALSPSRRGPSQAPGATPASPAAGAAPPTSQRPSPETMAELARLWPSLLSRGTDARTTASHLTPAAKMAADERVSLKAPDARFVLRFEEDFPATQASPPHQNVTSVAVEELDKDRMSGKFVQGISVAPALPGDASFPFNTMAIRLEGSFVAYRVPDAPAATAGAASSAGSDSRSALAMVSRRGG